MALLTKPLILILTIVILISVVASIKFNKFKEGARGRRPPPPPPWRPPPWRPPPPPPPRPVPIPPPLPPPPPPPPPLPNPNFNYVGCYRDTEDRAIPNFLGKVSSKEQCKELARNKYFNIYGLQNNGDCWGGNDINQARKYGEIGGCPTMGGGWTNQIYTNIQVPPRLPLTDLNSFKKNSFLDIDGKLNKGQHLISNNGDYILFFSLEGELTLRKVFKYPDNSPRTETYTDANKLKHTRISSTLVWDSGIRPNQNAKSLDFTKGNLVLVDSNNSILWSSKTNCMDGAKASVHNDGYLAIYRADGIPIWSSGQLNPYNENNLLPSCKKNKWQIIPGFGAPMRIDPESGEVQCLSYDAINCTWGNSNLSQIRINDVRPLSCGEDHRRKWGGPGYDNPGHWCSKVKQALT